MANIGYLAQLWVGADEAATTATVQLAKLTNITPPEMSVDALETTSLDGTDYVREFMPGLIDPGEVGIDMNWDPGMATEDVIVTMLTGRETRYFEIRYPQMTPSVDYGGRGFFTSFAKGPSIDEVMTASATLKAAGLWEEV